MKKLIKKFVLPIVFGVTLTTITIMGLLSIAFVGCEPNCADGELAGTDGSCYKCSSGSTATYSPSGNCSNAIAGVYCCSGGGGGGCTPTGCPTTSPWLCGSYCYATPPSGNHSCIKCP